jgi:hypothetical protein
MLFDDRAEVVALERNRPLRERPGHRVAVRERLGVVIHLDRLVVAGDHHHAVMRLAPHRPVPAQVLVVRVRILVERSGAEEVDGVEVGVAQSVSASSQAPIGPQYGVLSRRGHSLRRRVVSDARPSSFVSAR